VHDPQIVILDEPQAGLDPQSRILVREYVKSLAGTKTVILTTHDMDEADRLAERIGIIDHGRLLVLDTPDELKRRVGAGDVLEVKIGERHEAAVEAMRETLSHDVSILGYEQDTLRLAAPASANALPMMLDRLRESHLSYEDVTVRKRTLEDVFIALTGRRLRE
jgi:ABC-2 type transport system ATP-binding protein